jgi:catechol 2,3-dioxygenase-like lactoylglutathione lyase family enzyme
MQMLHHLSFAVADLSRAAAFYDPVLATLGYVRVWSASDAIGYGPVGGGDRFAIKAIGTEATVPSKGFHAAFSAATNAAVDAFHAAAIANGGADNGRPGLRRHYGPTYYAAFVVDPDGYRIEAVCK